MALTSGKKLGSYEIQSPLGAGGMGEVYRARDTRLGREVAIKILPRVFTSDPERLARFEREAQMLASLNNPHIGAIYGIEEANDVRALVLELVEGETLADRLAHGAVPITEALTIARQIAEALEAAHEKGIIHRDLKPANVKVTPEGTVKVLDFGLAKVAAGAASGMDLTVAPTVTVGGTRDGIILGTPAYMSPEQARGQAVDKRTDIWAFGCVLYEMLTGRQTFAGETLTDTLAAIVEREPDWTALPAATLAGVTRLLHRCLEKDPRQRLHDIADARIAVDDAFADRDPVPARVVAQRKGRNRLVWSVAAVVLSLFLAAAVLVPKTEFFWKNPLENAQFSRLTNFEGAELDASVSFDGKFAVFLSDRDGPVDAWVTQIGTGEFKNLTTGRFPDLFNEIVRNLGFSPDGSKVWLAVNEQGKFDNWLVPTMGGTARPFIAGAVQAAWSPDGSQVAYHGYTAGDPIFLADRDGTNKTRIFIDKPGYHDHYLTWSPDGHYIYFVRGVMVTRRMDIWRVPASGGDPERITNHRNWVTSPTALDDRTLLYSSPAGDGSGPWLYAVDVERRVPHRVSLGVEQYTSISATADGRRLVATVTNPTGHLWRLSILNHPATETEVAQVELPNVRAVSPRYGPDYFLYLASRGGGDGLWKFKDGRATELWKGSENGLISAPAVSSDGHVSFTLGKQGRGTLYAMNADGTGVHTLAESLDVIGVPSWSPDGKWIVVTGEQSQEPRLFKVPVEGGAPVRLVNEMASNPVWSPDGTRILYSGVAISAFVPLKAVSPEGKSLPFPDVRVRVAGERYRFLPDGKGLVFMRGDWKKQDFFLLDLGNGHERRLSNLVPGFSIRSFDISPDGKQIVFDRVRDNSDIVLIDLKR
jgi:Tol biopolymer transport system component